MKLLVKLFGVLAVIAGLLVVVSPDTIFNFINDNRESTSLYAFAIVIRLAIGILFILAAKRSKFPLVFRILGFLFIITAVTFVIMGQSMFQEILTSLVPKFKPYSMVAGLVSICLGGLLVYAFSNAKGDGDGSLSTA